MPLRRNQPQATKTAQKRARCEAAVPPARPDCPVGRAEGGARCVRRRLTGESFAIIAHHLFSYISIGSCISIAGISNVAISSENSSDDKSL